MHILDTVTVNKRKEEGVQYVQQRTTMPTCWAVLFSPSLVSFVWAAENG
jgi:hypothetical protein